MPKPKVFLSHIHSEKDLAIKLKDELLDQHLLAALDIFVSSDSSTNLAGTSWLHNIEDSLTTAQVILILASPFSIERPWINVEAGAGWIRYLQAKYHGGTPVYIMPLCHSGLNPGQLPLPWSTFNAVQLRTQGGLYAILDTCARAAGLGRSPQPDLSTLLRDIIKLEEFYSKYREIAQRINNVAKALGIQPNDFLPPVPVGEISVLRKVPQGALFQAEPDLIWLKSNGHIEYVQGSILTQAGGTNSGTFIDVHFRPTDTFIQDTLPKLQL